MRLTMTNNGDGTMSVYVNGEMFNCNKVPSTVPAKVSAVQVYTTYTEVENLDLTVEVFSDPPSYVHELVEAWQEAKKAEEEFEPLEPVDVNTATFEELVSLNGVSEARAQAIIDGRPWGDVADLTNISGISLEMVLSWYVMAS